MELSIKKSLYRYPNDYIFLVMCDGKILKRCFTLYQAKQFIEEMKSNNNDLELGVDWEYDWNGNHIALTNKAKRRINR